MRAFQVEGFDRAPRLVKAEAPKPAPHEVCVNVKACGLNFADLLLCQGKYQETPSPPFVLGLEAAGVIDAVGAEVSGLRVGQRVAVFAPTGGLADYLCVSPAVCTPLPDDMDFLTAAGFQIAYGTSHLVLTHRARLQSGETLLVLGAAGGVGLTAVEIGAALGATVIAAARGQDKCEVAKSAGAHHVLNTETDDIRQAVKDLGGADVVYDPVGGDLFKPALRACNPLARYLAIGFASGDVPQAPANILLVKNIDLIGFYWGGYLKFRPDLLTKSMSELFELYTKGKLSPHISHVLPLEDTAEGLRLIKSREATGKVVIEL